MEMSVDRGHPRAEWGPEILHECAEPTATSPSPEQCADLGGEEGFIKLL